MENLVSMVPYHPKDGAKRLKEKHSVLPPVNVVYDGSRKPVIH